MEKRRFLYAGLTVILLIAIARTSVVSAQDPTIYVNPAKIVTFPGSNFTISVKIENVTDLCGFIIQFRWNTTFIEYSNHTVHVPVEEYSDGVLHEPVLKIKDVVDENDSIPGAEPGTMYLLAVASHSDAPSFNGSGTIFEMTFHCKSLGNCTLDFCSTVLADSQGTPILHEVKGGIVIIDVNKFVVVGDNVGSNLNLWKYQWTGAGFDSGSLVDTLPFVNGFDLEIFDGDNDRDLEFVVAVGMDETIKLYLYNDSVRREIPNTMIGPGINWAHIDVGSGDFNNDGKIDFIVTSGGNRVTEIYPFINRGGLSFTQYTYLSATWATHAWGIDTADFNEDGNEDFTMFDYPNNLIDFQDDVYVYFGDGNGAFNEQFAFKTLHSVAQVTAEDFNNDGHFDILIGKNDKGDPGQTWLYKGKGDGTFQNAVESFDLDTEHEGGSGWNEGCGGMDAYDADNDGHVDVIACASGLGKVYFLKGDGTGTNFQEILIDDTLTYPIAVAAVRWVEHDVAITDIIFSFPPLPPLQTVDGNIWAADFPEEALDEPTTGGGTSNAYDGDGNPYWTGPINQVLSYPDNISSVNSIHAYFLGNNTDRDLAPNTEYVLHPDGTVELLVPLDVQIYNEYYVIGVNATPPGWPALQHNCSGIQSVYVKFPNGTERFAVGGAGHFESPPPSEWWYEPDWPYELESWWATGAVSGPWNWPDDTEYWVNYTAASKITVDYYATRTRRPGPFAELGETIAIYVTVENQGKVNVTFSVSVYYILDWDPLIGKKTVKLEPAKSTTLTFYFTINMYDSYQILAEAHVAYDGDQSDNTRVTYVFCPNPNVWKGGGIAGGDPFRNTIA